jgi:antitoxin ParD1/3/4
VLLSLSLDPAGVERLIEVKTTEGAQTTPTSEVIREALRDWKSKRAVQLHELESLKADIDEGPTDVAAGRVEDFDADRIVERGRKLLATRSPSPPNPRPSSTRR